MGDDERGVAELENKATVGGARRDLTIYIVAPPAADVGVDDEGHRDWEHGRSECQEKQAAQRRHHMKTSAMKRSTSEISFAGDKQQPAVPRTMDVEGKDAGERARPNILIAGTPGCGKTTTSALIAVRESSAHTTPGLSSVLYHTYSHLLPLLSDPPGTHHRPIIVIVVAPQDATQLRHIDMGKVVRLSTPTVYNVSLSPAPLLARNTIIVRSPFRRCRCPSASCPPV